MATTVVGAAKRAPLIYNPITRTIAEYMGVSQDEAADFARSMPYEEALDIARKCHRAMMREALGSLRATLAPAGSQYRETGRTYQPECP